MRPAHITNKKFITSVRLPSFRRVASSAPLRWLSQALDDQSAIGSAEPSVSWNCAIRENSYPRAPVYMHRRLSSRSIRTSICLQHVVSAYVFHIQPIFEEVEGTINGPLAVILVVV